MKQWTTTIVLIAALALLSGCGRTSGDEEQSGTDTTQAVAQSSQENSGQGGAGGENGQNGGRGQGFDSQFLTSDYEGALTPMMQLVMGGLQLEGTESAITPEQAAKLLPFWQGITGGAITNGEERNAVLKQIEATMTDGQMQAIVDMQLTFEDMGAWAEANGVEIPQFGGGEDGQGGPGGAGGRGGAFAALTDEQRQELRDLSQEERVAKLREFGIEVPEGGFGGGGQGGQGGGGQGGAGGAGADGPRAPGGRFGALMQPLVDLLEARASE